jgi:soluble lytic murein transglycosylase-like protein
MRAFAIGMISASLIVAAPADAATETVRGTTEALPNGKESAWLFDMSTRLEDRIPDKESRMTFLRIVQSEAKRAGVDPQLVLSLIDVASGFKKYAVAPGGARGYMMVNPSWQKTIGTPDANLFHLTTNIRYGCAVLRQFIDQERGNVQKALVRYRGQMDREAEADKKNTEGQKVFSDTVVGLLKTRWLYDGAVP